MIGVTIAAPKVAGPGAQSLARAAENIPLMAEPAALNGLITRSLASRPE
jgi:hypothetical protein